MSSVAFQMKILIMKLSLIKASPTASAFALGKTLAHQLPVHDTSAGDTAVLLGQEEAEKTVRHFSVSLLAQHWNQPGHSPWSSPDTRMIFTTMNRNSFPKMGKLVSSTLSQISLQPLPFSLLLWQFHIPLPAITHCLLKCYAPLGKVSAQTLQ